MGTELGEGDVLYLEKTLTPTNPYPLAVPGARRREMRVMNTFASPDCVRKVILPTLPVKEQMRHLQHNVLARAVHGDSRSDRVIRHDFVRDLGRTTAAPRRVFRKGFRVPDTWAKFGPGAKGRKRLGKVQPKWVRSMSTSAETTVTAEVRKQLGGDSGYGTLVAVSCPPSWYTLTCGSVEGKNFRRVTSELDSGAVPLGEAVVGWVPGVDLDPKAVARRKEEWPLSVLTLNPNPDYSRTVGPNTLLGNTLWLWVPARNPKVTRDRARLSVTMHQTFRDLSPWQRDVEAPLWFVGPGVGVKHLQGVLQRSLGSRSNVSLTLPGYMKAKINTENPRNLILTCPGRFRGELREYVARVISLFAPNAHRLRGIYGEDPAGLKLRTSVKDKVK